MHTINRYSTIYLIINRQFSNNRSKIRFDTIECVHGYVKKYSQLTFPTSSNGEHKDISLLGRGLLPWKRFTNLRISSWTLRKCKGYIKRRVFLPAEILLSFTHLAPQRELHRRWTTRRAAAKKKRGRALRTEERWKDGVESTKRMGNTTTS